MPASYAPVTAEPRQGGALNTQYSFENVGAANYVVKRDWRRSFDAEIRREGHAFFQPNSAALGTQPYPEGGPGNPIVLVHTCRRANGQIATIAGTQTTLYRYFSFDDGNVYDGCYETGTYANESGSWITIGSNFSADGHRWEAVDVAGVTILNNGVDLPQEYDLSWRRVRPIYELREQGVSSVGTITCFNGMLLCSDISNMTQDYQDAVMGGTFSGGVTAMQSGTSVVANASFFTPSMVGQTLVFTTGFPAKITGYGSATTVQVDTAQNVSSTTFTVAILFGVADDPTQISRVRYQILTSNVGFPDQFGALFTGSAVIGSAQIILDSPAYSLEVGDSVTVSGIGAQGTAITANITAVDNIAHEFIYLDQVAQESTQSVTFNVGATPSAGTLSYQWSYNGATIPGATASSYTVDNVSTSDAGNYSCALEDSNGLISSQTAILNVYPAGAPPVITRQPFGTTVSTYDGSWTFSIGAVGEGTLTYQWLLNSIPIPGATGYNYPIPRLYSQYVGSYACTVTSSNGSSVTSAGANFSFVPPGQWTTPTITSQPTNLVALAGSASSLEISATGAPNVQYEWQKDISSVWTDIYNSNNPYPQGPSYIFPTLQASDAGSYRCLVFNTAGIVTSSTATVTVNNPMYPIVTSQPTGEYIFNPANVTVQNSTYVGSTISSTNLQDDGSAILRSVDLRGTLVIFKDTGIFVGTYTGVANGPITYQKVYQGPDTLYWKWMMTPVDGTYVLYATQKDFFTFDLSILLPRKHPQLRLCANVFYGQGLTEYDMDSCFISTNELTREVWAIFPSSGPDYGLCYDYEFQTCSTLGYPYTSAVTIETPTATTEDDPKRNFIAGDINGILYTYGLDTETGSIYTRNGSNYDSLISGGYVSFNDEYNEKDLRSYMAYCRELAPFTVTLYGARNANEPPVLLCTQTIPTPTYQTLVATFFRQNYFQDQLLVTGTSNGCTLVRRLWDAARIDSRSTIKHA